jgi:hypothetical protein
MADVDMLLSGDVDGDLGFLAEHGLLSWNWLRPTGD